MNTGSTNPWSNVSGQPSIVNPPAGGQMLHVILRTCSESSVHFKQNQRFIPIPKHGLIIQCLKSLIISLNQAVQSQNCGLKLSVIDDHSTETCIADIQNILNACTFEKEFIVLSEKGNNASMKFSYNLAKNSDHEVVYLVEDDYLHTTSCIEEMIEAYNYFKKKLDGKEVAIMPVDNRFHYLDNTMFSSPLVLGPRRHFRVNYYSNWTMMLSQKSIIDHFDVWSAFSNYELSKPETHEDTLLVPLFKKHINLFTPIPTLALHIAGANYESPFSNWQKIWNKVDEEWNKLN